MLAKNSLIKRVAWIEKHGERFRSILEYADMGNVTHFLIVSRGGDRTAIWFDNIKLDLRVVPEQGTAPATWPKRADGREGQQVGTDG